MKHLPLLCLIVLFTGLSAHSQTVKGKLVDPADNKPLQGATLILRSSKDSNAVLNAFSDSTGVFQFNQVGKDTFFLTVSYVGYEEYRQLVSVSDSTPSRDLGQLYVPKSTKELTGVTVTTKTPPVSQKGDTLQFNASQYKVNPDATVEDLVKKAPGVTVDRDGTVTAQGEQVRKVTIDGKDFFGDDASAALRNLPADIVDKIQVYDRLSDQATVTGVDDGNTTKALNIVTKAGLQNGQFGRFYAGYGTDDRYAAGGNVSFFKGNRRISLVGLSNNINQQNFGSQDLLGVTSTGGGGRGNGGGGRGGGGNFGGGGSGNFTITPQKGISKTNGIGVNFSDKYGKKVDVSGSYFFNNSNLSNDMVSNTQSLAKADSILFKDQEGTTRTNNYNHRVNLRVEYRIDSSNTILITPSLSTQRNRSLTTSHQENYYAGNDGFQAELQNNRSSLNTGYNFNNNILYRHAFAKRGRSISLNLNTAFNNRDGWTYQESYTRTITGNNDSVNQYFDNIQKGRTLSANLVYTEPIGAKGQLQINYQPSLTHNTADKETYKYTPEDKAYTTFDPSQSNKFENDYNTQNTGVTYRIGDRDNQFAVGANYQYSSLQSDQVYPQVASIDRKFTNILPNLQLRRKLSNRSSIRVFYRASVNAPSVNQLQNVLDNTNPLSVSIGNPNLDQQYSHTVNARYTFTNVQKGQSFVANIFLQQVNDFITDALYTANNDSILTPTFTLSKGGQISKPVNLDGYYSLRSFASFGQPVSFIKSNISVKGEFSFTRTPGVSNGVTSFTNVTGYTGGIGLASNVSEYVDFNLSYDATFNSAKNAIQPRLNSNYVIRVARIQFNLLSKNGWFLQNDLLNQANTGYSAGFNQSYWLWNMGAGKKLLKNRRGEIKLSVFDLLKQNQSITRTVSGVDIIDERNTVLQRYFMMTFTYNLKNFGTAKSSGGQGGQGRERGQGFYGEPGGRP